MENSIVNAMFEKNGIFVEDWESEQGNFPILRTCGVLKLGQQNCFQLPATTYDSNDVFVEVEHYIPTEQFSMIDSLRNKDVCTSEEREQLADFYWKNKSLRFRLLKETKTEMDEIVQEELGYYIQFQI